MRAERARRLAELERLLDTSAELTVPLDAFFDLVERDPGLTLEAVPVRPVLLSQFVGHALQELFGPDLARAGRVELCWRRLPEHAFVHGGVRVGQRLGAAFAFERRGMGLVGFPGGDGHTHCLRLRSFAPDASEPESN